MIEVPYCQASGQQINRERPSTHERLLWHTFITNFEGPFQFQDDINLPMLPRTQLALNCLAC